MFIVYYTDSAHTGILPSVIRPFFAFRVWAWIQGYFQILTHP